MKETKKPSFAIRAACVLLCLVLISVHFTSGLYARYISKAVGSDRSRSAAFQVSAELEQDTNSNSFNVKLNNRSETAVRCSITVRPKAADMFSEIKLGEIAGNFENGVVTFPNVSELAPGAENTLVLSLTVNSAYSDPDAVSALLDFNNDSTTSVDSERPFTVVVGYEQIN